MVVGVVGQAVLERPPAEGASEEEVVRNGEMRRRRERVRRGWLRVVVVPVAVVVKLSGGVDDESVSRRETLHLSPVPMAEPAGALGAASEAPTRRHAGAAITATEDGSDLPPSLLAFVRENGLDLATFRIPPAAVPRFVRCVSRHDLWPL